MNSERRSARIKDKLIFNTGMNETTPKAVPFTPKTEGDRLAMEIARSFNDETSLPKYQQLCASHDPVIVKRVFLEVQRIPLERIKRSRGALFTYLVKKYAKR